MTENQWKFFTTTTEAWDELLLACSRAEQTIDFEQYIFGAESPITRAFADVFIQKAKTGVSVRLLLDAVGSFGFYRSSLYHEMKEAGIEMNFHWALLPQPLKRALSFIIRDHRKLTVIDKKIVYVGGIIIEERAREWRDTLVRIEGKIASEFQSAFDNAWRKTLKMKAAGQVVSNDTKKDISLAGNSFHLHNKDLYRSFLRSIVGAKKNIYITTPYFLPGREFMRALSFARKRGVEISLLLPKTSDVFLADLVARLYFKKLRKRGIRIFLYTKSILHAKSIVVDDTWSSVGSCNMDWLSFWFNYELNVISTDERFTAELADHFRLDCMGAEEIS